MSVQNQLVSRSLTKGRVDDASGLVGTAVQLSSRLCTNRPPCASLKVSSSAITRSNRARAAAVSPAGVHAHRHGHHAGRRRDFVGAVSHPAWSPVRSLAEASSKCRPASSGASRNRASTMRAASSWRPSGRALRLSRLTRDGGGAAAYRSTSSISLTGQEGAVDRGGEEPEVLGTGRPVALKTFESLRCGCLSHGPKTPCPPGHRGGSLEGRDPLFDDIFSNPNNEMREN